VVEVLDLRTMYLGPGRLLVAARLDLKDDVDAGTIEQLSETIDRELREEIESVDQVFFDATPRRPRTEAAALSRLKGAP
jgi:divalent metal cation (Fe/Co/Zn/Cd) transporter